MTIIGLQRRIQEAGRLRIGQQVPTASGKTRPAKLESWRVTSPDRTRIEHIARMYGGQVQPWKSPNGDQWEVITDTDVLPVIVPPPVMAFTMKYELWSAGGCQRRCDGEQESLSDGPCLCDPDNRDCDIHTRLSVMLRDVPGLGVYRLDTQGYYAAVELSGAVEIISLAASRGQMLPARLRLEQRSVKRQINGKPETRRFPVPVLDIDIAPGLLVLGTSPDLPQVEEAPPPKPTIAQQIEDDNRFFASAQQPATPAAIGGPKQDTPAKTPGPQKPSQRRAPAIPPTGRRPRTQAEATAALPPPDKSSQQQMRHMFALLKKHGLADDRDGSLTIVEQITGRRVESRNELTSAETSRILDVLNELNPVANETIADLLVRIADHTARTILGGENIDPETGETIPAEVGATA